MLRICFFLLIAMFINKLLDHNGSASILFNNEKAKVNSLHYFDSSGCYFSCCDHKFYNRSEISGEKWVISRQTTSDLAELTEIWSFIEHFCKVCSSYYLFFWVTQIFSWNLKGHLRIWLGRGQIFTFFFHSWDLVSFYMIATFPRCIHKYIKPLEFSIHVSFQVDRQLIEF